MPLGLLLQETIYTLRWGAYHLEPWSHLVQVEELLIDRARGAFLTHWFGPGLPLRGSYVNFVIENLAALRQRYILARQSMLPGEEGASLAEPLGGMIGALGGIFLSPTGQILSIAVMLRDQPGTLKVLKDALGWYALGLPLLPVLGPVLGPFAIAYVAGSKLKDYGKLLGPVAKLLTEATKFIKLLLGPRNKIKNPLLADILGFFDQLAGLVPFVLAFVAFVVVEIGPLIEPLAGQIAPFSALIDEVVSTLTDIFTDIPGALQRFWPLVADRLDFVMVQLENVFPVFSIAFTELFTNLGESLWKIIEAGKTDVKTWYNNARDKAKEIIKAQPVMQSMEAGKIAFKIARSAMKSTGSKSPPGWLSRHTIGFVENKISDFGKDFVDNFPQPPNLVPPSAVMGAMGGPPPGGLSAIGTLADIDIRHHGALFQAYTPYSDDALAGLDSLRPTYVFDAEHIALVGELGGKKPKDALAALRADQLKLRDLLSEVVGRVLPGELRVQMGALLGLFSELDVKLYQGKAEKRDYPVRDLPDNGQLRPIVHRLVIRGVDMVRAETDTFQQRLQEAMNALAYPATKPADVAAMAGA